MAVSIAVDTLDPDAIDLECLLRTATDSVTHLCTCISIHGVKIDMTTYHRNDHTWEHRDPLVDRRP